MKLQIQKMTVGLILIAGLLTPLGLQAQTFLGTPWTQSSPAVTTGTDSNGTFLSTAPLNSSLTFNSTETSTSNPQFLWVPSRGALRAGFFSSPPSTTNMGQYSTAFGYATTASGSYATAMGDTTFATGSNATAMGMYSSASGTYATAMGFATTASGTYGTAMGVATTATAAESTSMGVVTTASGPAATAMGAYTTASGGSSTAAGFETKAAALDSFAVGTYNVGGGNAGTWVATDPLFEVGNGTGTSQLRDALVVYKNGNTTIYGSDNELPNQTLTGAANPANSILTKSIADSRYLAIGGGSSATSLALFSGASVTGTDSVAMGYNAQASGNYAFAGGNTVTASGTYSSAFGANTTAAAYDSTVFGQYNVGGGSSSSWSSGDPLFEIGDGTSPTATSDALRIDKSGNETVQGNVTAGGNLSAAAITSSGAITAASVTTTGATSTASLTATSTVTAPTFVTTAPNGSGDIPMYTGN